MPFEGEKFEEIPPAGEEKEEIEKIAEELQEEKGPIEVQMGFEEKQLAERYKEIDEKGAEKEMNRLKLEIRREYTESDPRAPERMLGNLSKEKDELIRKAEEYKRKLKEPGADIPNLDTAIRSFREEAERLEFICKEYDVARNPRPLKAYAEEALDNLLRKSNKWEGREGFEKLHEALFLKRTINTIEYQLEKELELEE